MIKLLVSLLLIFVNLNAKTIKPNFNISSKGFVNDFVISNEKIYIANDEGSVEVFDLASKKLINEIFIDPVFTAKQEWINAKILSVDVSKNKILIVSSNNTPYRDVWIYDGENLEKIINQKKKLAIKEARFTSTGKILFATLGYEMILYNQKDDYNSYKTQVEQSSFEDVVLNKDKTKMVSSSESGQIILSDVKSGNIIKKYKPLNLDKVYQVDYQNGVIITGGQDRRVGIYPKNTKPYYLKSTFLVYSVALSPSGKRGVYSSGDDSSLQLFDVSTGKKLDIFKGHYAIPTTIKFYNEKGFFSAGYENKIFYWKID